MGRYDRYGRRQESPLEKIGNTLSNIRSNLEYSINSLSKNVQDFISPPKKHYGYNSYYSKQKSSVDWGFVATRGPIIAALSATIATAVQAGPNALKMFANRQVNAASPPDNINNPLPPITPIPSTEISKPKTEWVSGITLNYDDKGNLSSYQTESGKVVSLDRESFEQLKNTAATTYETQIIGIINQKRETPTPKQFVPSEEIPRIEELPPDTVTDKELADRGINIIQTPQGTSLYLRKSIFNKGELFEKFKQNGDQKLTIVLVDNGYLTANAMEDKRYDGYRETIAKEEVITTNIRQDDINLYQDHIETTRQEIQDALKVKDFEKAKNLGSTIPSLEIRISQIKKEGNTKKFSGLFDSHGPNSNPVIYVAVGENLDENSPIQTAILIDSEGNIQISKFIVGTHDFVSTPKPEQSYPDPSTYKLNIHATPSSPGEPPDESYLVKTNTPGFTFYHEAEHLVHIVLNPSNDAGINQSEYRTDEDALKQIESAHKKWRTDKDDSGYNLIFRNKFGELIMTDNNTSKSTI